MLGFDPVYFIFVGPAILLALWSQFKVKSAFSKASQVPASSGLSGAEVAAKILQLTGVDGVGIEQTDGFMGDHYDPKAKKLRLSADVYHGRSLASLGVAAHEVGHAIQDAERYSLLVARNAIVPMASLGSNLSWVILFGGFIMNSMNLIFAGIVLFSLTVLFQIVNLPVEFDASARAKTLLVDRGFISPAELPVVKNVLSAAAMTYVAATISAVLTLLYYLYRAGLIGGSDD